MVHILWSERESDEANVAAVWNGVDQNKQNDWTTGALILGDLTNSAAQNRNCTTRLGGRADDIVGLPFCSTGAKVTPF